MNIIRLINDLFRDKRFKLYVALFSIVQGLYRTEILNNPQDLAELFKNFNIFFGGASLLLGVLLLALILRRHSNIVVVKITESLLCALYAAFGASILNTSPISAYGAFIITAILFIEVSIINEC